MFEWEVRPDDARVVDLDKTYTPDGEPCEVKARFEYLLEGEVVGYRSQNINPGWVRANFPQLTPEEAAEKFLEFFSAIPDIPQAILTAVTAKIPKSAFRKAW